MRSNNPLLLIIQTVSNNNPFTNPIGTQGFQGSSITSGNSIGFQGNLGAQGIMNTEGINGSQGLQGNIIKGLQGESPYANNSDEGNQGFQGYQNVENVRGIQGSIGMDGFQYLLLGKEGILYSMNGIQGNQGIDGTPGLSGYHGDIGFTNHQGFDGVQGFDGDQGPSYMIIGNQGFDNYSGVDGLNGYSGYDNNTIGNQGHNSVLGIIGFDGVQGIDSTLVGSIGTDGVQGVEGIVFRGFQGFPAEELGTPGTQGFQSNMGFQGFDGESNGDVQGTQGYQSNGFQGPRAWPAATPGSRGYIGFQGIQGYQSGIQGTQGRQGLGGPFIGLTPGNQGSQGFQGTQGFSAPYSMFNVGLQGLGSTINSIGLLFATPVNYGNNTSLVSGTMIFQAVYIPMSCTVTGVSFLQRTTGNFTSTNENRIGLYSYSSTTSLTLVASTTSNVSTWQQTSSVWSSVALSSTYLASDGIYFIASLYTSTSVTTTPQINGASAAATNAAIIRGGFTNTVPLASTLSSQTSLPSTVTIASLTVTNGNTPWFSLY